MLRVGNRRYPITARSTACSFSVDFSIRERGNLMATFLAKITIFEGKEAAFEETARMMWEATHAHEPNCRRYEYWRGAEPRSYYGPELS